MNNYVDLYGRYHDKPVTDSDPVPSNNGWIYTAYVDKAGLPVDSNQLDYYFVECHVDFEGFPTRALFRSPGKSTPPISRDEILGVVSLGLLKNESEIIQDWNFSPYPLPKFSLIKLVKQLWELRPGLLADKYITLFNFFGGKAVKLPFGYHLAFKHRNYFWQNGLDQIYRFAFSVPLSDRHFILKKWGKFHFYNPVHLFYAAVGKINSKLNPGALDWLKYGEKRGLDSLRHEFPEDHPIIQKLGL